MLMRSAHLWDITLGHVVVLGLLTLENGTDTLSRKVGKELSHDAASYPRKAQIFYASRFNQSLFDIVGHTFGRSDIL